MRFKKLAIIIFIFFVGTRISAQLWVVPDEQKAVVAPFKFTPEMQKQGEQIYLKNCQSCHGLPGKDNWVKLTPPPGDLAKEKAQKQTDGELFYRITAGKVPMPEFRNILPDNERWGLIAYIRSFNPSYIQPNPAAQASFTGRIVTLAMDYSTPMKKIVVTASEQLKDGKTGLAAGVEVMLFVKRYFGKMQVGDIKTTNARGQVLFEFPADLPGNKEGYVEVSALVNDTKSQMKTTPATASFAIGAPTDRPSLTETRAWWSTRGNAPVWILITFTLSVIIVWGFILYILYSLLRMRKLKNKGLVFGVLILIFSGLCSIQSTAQVVEGIEEEMGIVEHLDTIIPANITFNNEQGQPVPLLSLINKPTILTLVFYNCPGICPELLSGVSDAIEKMGLELGKDYQVMTVSFDPNDTPENSVEKKKNYLRPHSKPRSAHWMYFTGDSANIYSLTNAVGYNFTKSGNGFMHPACIIVLSPQGKVTRYLYGTSYLPFDVKMAVVEAQKGQSRPTINRVLEYCFSYDPEGRKYTLQVTKITATIIIFFAVLLFIILIVKSSRKKSKI